MSKLILFAPNVGSGGGLVLLRALMSSDWVGMDCIAVLDRRAEHELAHSARGFDVHWAASSLVGRYKAERLLADMAGPGDLVLCFHNLPPILSNSGRVICYVQNAYLVGLIPISRLARWPRLRTFVEEFIARKFRHRVERYVVQTQSMADALRKWYGPGAVPIDVMPFVPTHAQTNGASALAPHAVPTGAKRDWDFIYVSDGPAHKNHKHLFEAWQLLAKQGLTPSLAVTLHPERDRALADQVRSLAAKGLRISDLGVVSHEQVLAIYHQAQALIFPSYTESFGIPLLEAAAAGLPILAPELDYVRDVCQPTVTFDAASPRSIARAVMRFLGKPSDIAAIGGAQDFADEVVRLATRSQPTGHRSFPGNKDSNSPAAEAQSG